MNGKAKVLWPRVAWCVGAVCVFMASRTSAQPFEPYHVEVTPPGAVPGQPLDLNAAKQWRDTLIQAGFDVGRCGFHPAASSFAVDVMHPDQQAFLDGAGFSVVSQSAMGPLEDGLRVQSQYYDPNEIEALLDQVALNYPAITRVFTIGTTFHSRPIKAIEISDNPGIDEDEPAVQLNGQHHAREVATSHIVMDAIEQLTAGYGVNPQITDWVNNYKTVCVPMVNPDGVSYVFSNNSLWRKNRQQYSCVGVDLNRNYPYLWGPGCGSSGSCSSDIYRGPVAASELETQAMQNLAEDFNFVFATSYHSYGRFIDYPYACGNGSPSSLMPEHAVIHEMMNGMADAIDAVDSVPRYDVYSPVPFGGVNGDDTSNYYAQHGTYAFIVEVGTSFEPAFSQVAGIVNRNRAGWMYLYERLGEARIDIHVTDACSGAPLEAEVTLLDYVFDSGESPRMTFLPYGRWTFVTPAEDWYTVRATKAGYVAQNVEVYVAGEPASVDIALMPVIPPLTTFGDRDCDWDVDLVDFLAIPGCLSLPDNPAKAGCEYFDSDADGDVDLIDLAAFQAAFTGPQ